MDVDGDESMDTTVETDESDMDTDTEDDLVVHFDPESPTITHRQLMDFVQREMNKKPGCNCETSTCQDASTGAGADQNDGPDRVLMYLKRIDDGMDDRFTIRAHLVGEEAFVSLEQSPSDNLSRNILEMTAEQWRVLEDCYGRLEEFIAILEHDEMFTIDAFHIVGRLYCDAYLIDGEPRIWLYLAEQNTATGEIFRPNHSCVCLTEQVLKALHTEFDRIWREVVQIQECEPCFSSRNHSKNCKSCFPF